MCLFIRSTYLRALSLLLFLRQTFCIIEIELTEDEIWERIKYDEKIDGVSFYCSIERAALFFDYAYGDIDGVLKLEAGDEDDFCVLSKEEAGEFDCLVEKLERFRKNYDEQGDIYEFICDWNPIETVSLNPLTVINGRLMMMRWYDDFIKTSLQDR